MDYTRLIDRIFKKDRCFIITEAGVNHNGKLSLAKKMVNEAKKAGADAVKFQTFKAEELATQKALTADYQKNNLGGQKSQLEMLKGLELSENDFKELKKYCDQKKIIFLSTPHTEKAADFLETLVPAFKIASGDLTNIPFLKKIAKKGKPVILSTGMADLKEVEEVVEAIKRAGNKKIILLHCTTNYPTTFNEVNLRAMGTMGKKFKLPVGYSDHTKGIEVSLAAVAMGARVIEKHFTINKNLPGPDHKASLEPTELKKMVEGIRNIEKAMGDGIKKPTASELKIAKVARKSVVAKVDIFKGEKISSNMLAIKRPGTGIEPKYFFKIIGKKAFKNIQKDSLIKLSDIHGK